MTKNYIVWRDWIPGVSTDEHPHGFISVSQPRVGETVYHGHFKPEHTNANGTVIYKSVGPYTEEFFVEGVEKF